MKNLVAVAAILFAGCFGGEARGQGLANTSYEAGVLTGLSGKIPAATPTYQSVMECSIVDGSGNILLAGASDNTVAAFSRALFNGFSGGSNGASPSVPGSIFYYISKYNSVGEYQTGTYIYGNQVATTDTNFNIYGIVADNSGNVYITGFFKGTYDFDGGAGITNLVSLGNFGDAFIAKYDASLNYVWVKRLGSASASPSLAIPKDISISPTTGNIWITGHFSGLPGNIYVDLDPGAGSFLLSGTYSLNAFLGGYTSSGSFVAGSKLSNVNNSNETNEPVLGTCLAINALGKLFIGITSSGNIDLGASCTFAAGQSLIWQYDPTNPTVPACPLTALPVIAISDIEVDASGNIFWCGDNKVHKYTSALAPSWGGSKTLGSSANALAVDNSGNVFCGAKGTSSEILIQKYSASGSAQFGVNGFSIPSNLGTTGIRELRLVGTNLLIGGEYFSLSAAAASQDIGFDLEVITVGGPSNQVNVRHQFWGIYRYDNAGPIGTITSTAPAATNVSPIPITVTFDEPVTGFIPNDHDITNGTISNVVEVNNKTFTFDLSPIGQGTVSYQLFTGMFTDYHNNLNGGSNYFSRIYDTVAPSIVIASTSPNPLLNLNPFPITIDFNETILGFIPGDVTVTNGTMSSIVGSGTHYDCNITPDGVGTVTVKINAGMTTDAATNGNTASNTLSRSLSAGDTTPPTIIISSTAPSPTNVTPIPVTFTFNEVVTGFVVGDIGVVNGSAGTFAGSGTTYTANITPTGQGTVTVSVAANVAIDGASNGNTVATNLVRTFDNVAPTVTISSTTTSTTSVTPIPVTITFSESVTGFVIGDIGATGGSVGNFAGSGTTYTADITPSGPGTVTVSVAANVAVDAATNNNTAATNLVRTYATADTTPPTIIISSSSPNPTNTSPIPVTFTFNEVVTGFVIGDIGLINGSASAFAGSGTTYTANITPTGQGTVTVSVAGNVANDAAANGNTAATNLTRVFDNVAPTVTISSTAADPTNVLIPITISFNEVVTGFVIGDIGLINGSASAFAGSGTTYTANITPTGQGTVTVSLAANVATDATTNGNTAATNLTRVFDSVAPTVTISSSATDPTNVSPIPVTITFSESVTGFVVGDIGVVNGNASAFAGSGTTYSANITPTGQGTVTVSVAGNVANDAAVNGNTAATNLTRVFDNVAPTVLITSSASNPTNVSPIPVTFTFSESVTGFVIGDIGVVNGSPSAFTGSGTTYTANITPTGQGTVTVSVAANVATDAVTNGNTAAVNLTRVFDNVAPTVTITSSATDPTSVSPIPVTIAFSESVIGFVVGDITVTNGSAGNFAGSGTTYTADITPSGVATVSVSVAAAKATDAALNNNSVSNTLSRAYNNTSPTVTISSTVTEPTNISPIPITVTFSENMTGFVATDLIVTNGSAGNFSGSGTTYAANITPTGQGAVTVRIAANSAINGASVGNTISNTLTSTFDTVLPAVTISSTATDPTKVTPIPITITFSESVTGFVVGKIIVNNGTPGAFSGSGTTYTANIIPTAPGTVTVSVAANVASDAAANGNTAATNLTRVFDNVAPTVTITSTASDPTNATPFPVTITFSESVTGFVVGDIGVINGIAGSFGGSGATYTANITPTGQGTVTVLVAANVATDAATNANSAATNLTRLFDNVAPTVIVSSTSSDPTNISPIPVTITFSESVTGFIVGDITVTNGTLGSFAGSGTTYTANITPTGSGPVTVSVAAAKATDAAVNNNVASNTLTRTYNNTSPSVTITSSATDPTNVSPIPVTITFSESVTGFLVAEIIATNGTVGSFSGTGTTYTANITPLSAGAITVSVAANGAANGNTASNNLSRTFDNTSPTVTLSSSAIDPTNILPIPVTFTFSESVTGFVVGDINVTNGSASGFSGSGTTYTANIAPTGPGNVTVSVSANVAADAATNGNTAATNLTRVFDNVAPTVTITSIASDPTTASPISITITFSESVTGFTVGDIGVTNGNVGSFVGSGASYSASITPTSPGLVSVTIDANKANDAATNGNVLSNTFSRNFNNAALGNQIITFNAMATKTLGDTPFALSATSSSGLAVSFS